jgi:hypothetical protein
VTLFAAILAGLGLSQSEAAAFLDVRLDTVKSWSIGRNRVPDRVMITLHNLARRQEAFAIAVARGHDNGLPEAWPSERAYMAVLRRAWEMGESGVSPLTNFD